MWWQLLSTKAWAGIMRARVGTPGLRAERQQLGEVGNRVHVTRHPGHEIAGVAAGVEAEREALEMDVHREAKLVHDPLRGACQRDVAHVGHDPLDQGDPEHQRCDRCQEPEVAARQLEAVARCAGTLLDHAVDDGSLELARKTGLRRGPFPASCHLQFIPNRRLS